MQIRTRLGLRICIGVLLSLAPAADEQCSPLHTHLPVVAHDSQGTSCASHMRQHVDAACYGRFATGRCGHRPLRGACFAVGAAIGRPRNDPPNTTRRCKFVPGWVANLHRRCVIVGPCCGRAMLAPTLGYAQIARALRDGSMRSSTPTGRGRCGVGATAGRVLLRGGGRYGARLLRGGRYGVLFWENFFRICGKIALHLQLAVVNYTGWQNAGGTIRPGAQLSAHTGRMLSLRVRLQKGGYYHDPERKEDSGHP